MYYFTHSWWYNIYTYYLEFFNGKFNDKEVNKIMTIVKQVEAYDEAYTKLTDDE